jgi:ketosteroid isomerase-like protein
MSERENTELIHQAYQHFKGGDIQGLLGLLSEDVEWKLFEIEGVPFSGTRRGVERVGEFFSRVCDTEEPLHFEPRELVAQLPGVYGHRCC